MGYSHLPQQPTNKQICLVSREMQDLELRAFSKLSLRGVTRVCLMGP